MRKNEYIKIGTLELPFVRFRITDNLLSFLLVDDIDVSGLSFDVIELYNRGNSLLDTFTDYNTLYRYHNKSLELSNDGSVYVEPKAHEYIKVNGGDPIDVESVSSDGNILRIHLVSADDNFAAGTIQHYSVYDKLIETYEGYNTIYRIDGKEVVLSKDGSKYFEPREHSFIKVNGGDMIDVESCSEDGVLLVINFVEDPANVDLTGEIAYYSSTGDQLNTYTGYDTVYRVDDNKIQLSNDGSVFDAEADAAQKLEEAKTKKIEELSKTCADMINAGVDVQLDPEDPESYSHFSYTAEDQQNIKSAFDSVILTNLAVPYHADAMSCRTFAPEEIVKLYIAEQMNLTHNQTYFNQLKQMIMKMDNIEDVEAVNYGDALTGEYKETYDTMMEQTNTIIQAMTATLSKNEQKEEIVNEIS